MSVSYKTTDPAVLAAMAEYQAKRDALAEQASIIGAVFDGKPIFSCSVGDVSFAGLVLNNYQSREDKALWTVPNRDTRVSRPRAARVAGKTKDEQEGLRQQYISMLPATATFDAVWEAMGGELGEPAVQRVPPLRAGRNDLLPVVSAGRRGDDRDHGQ